MKLTLKKIVSASLLIVCGLAMQSCSAREEKETLPPEVRQRVGVRISDTGVPREELVSGWIANGFESIYISPDKSLIRTMAMFEKNDTSIFAIISLNTKEKYKTILDAQLLPKELLTYYFKNGKSVTKKQWWKFYSPTAICYREREEIIVGLMRPEQGKQDCSHKTKQVKKAWKVDQESGHISEIPTQGIVCSYMGGEYSCDSE
ncbi:MAG: hypothetical protein PHI29_04460 [Gallionella sp.]|nr:hypothetical protein [Gallionella sp.]